jgi:hypothetical protein
MVIRRCKQGRGFGGWLEAELVVATALIVLVMIPVGYSVHQEHKLARALYYRAIATEIVDGECEWLRAGLWRQLKEGENELESPAASLVNIQPGALIAIRKDNKITVEWRPATKGKAGLIQREFVIHENAEIPSKK